jgi:sulfotransferase family protein
MGHQGTPAELGTPVVGGEQVPRADGVAPVTFVGGTGRSGTHVLAQLLSRNEWLALVPVEVRFHTDPDGFPGLLAGEVTLVRFMKRLRGFWWRGFQTRRFRGMYRFVDRDRFDAAAGRFERSFGDRPEEACRTLFFDLLGFRADESEGAIGIVEQSTDTVAQAPTLTRLFGDARFIHVVRDGRDASASRVSQTRGLVRPRTREQGIDWWEERLAAIERGAEAIEPGRLLTMSLDELLQIDRSRVALRPLFRFVGAHVSKAPRRYFNNRMNASEAHSERWRRGITRRRADRIEARYEQALERLDAAGARSAPLLRRTFDRDRAPDLPPLVYVYDR